MSIFQWVNDAIGRRGGHACTLEGPWAEPDFMLNGVRQFKIKRSIRDTPEGFLVSIHFQMPSGTTETESRMYK